VIFLPNLLWEIQNHWPTLEILRKLMARSIWMIHQRQLALLVLIQIGLRPSWQGFRGWASDSEFPRGDSAGKSQRR